MTVLDPMSCTPADLANPAITQMDLARIAQFRPDMHPLVRKHPACYPELAVWIEQRAALQESDAPERSGARRAASDDGAASESASPSTASASGPGSRSASGPGSVSASATTASITPINDAITTTASPAPASDFEPTELPSRGRPAALASPVSADDTATPVGNVASPAAAVVPARSTRSARSAPEIIPPSSAPEVITVVPGMTAPTGLTPSQPASPAAQAAPATAMPSAPAHGGAPSSHSAGPIGGSTARPSPEPLIPASAVPSAMEQPADATLLARADDGTAALWRRLLLYAVPLLTVLCLVSTFLPIVTITFDTGTWSFNYWNGDGLQEALMLLAVFVIATGIGLAAIITPGRSRLILTGIAGAASALLAISDGFRNIIRFSGSVPDIQDATGASVGAGAILLAICGVVLLLISVLHLAFTMREEKPDTRTGLVTQPSPAPGGYEE